LGHDFLSAAADKNLNTLCCIAANRNLAVLCSAALQQTEIWPFCALLRCSKQESGHFVLCCIAANRNLAILWFAAMQQTGI
jgi:hypothetical protein